jgi:hypothetical protein
MLCAAVWSWCRSDVKRDNLGCWGVLVTCRSDRIGTELQIRGPSFNNLLNTGRWYQRTLIASQKTRSSNVWRLSQIYRKIQSKMLPSLFDTKYLIMTFLTAEVLSSAAGYLNEWLADWLTELMSIWLTDLLAVWLTDLLAVWLAEWLDDWLIGWMTGTECLTGLLIKWMADWLTNCLAKCRIGWLFD